MDNLIFVIHCLSSDRRFCVFVNNQFTEEEHEAPFKNVQQNIFVVSQDERRYYEPLHAAGFIRKTL